MKHIELHKQTSIWDCFCTDFGPVLFSLHFYLQQSCFICCYDYIYKCICWWDTVSFVKFSIAITFCFLSYTIPICWMFLFFSAWILSRWWWSINATQENMNRFIWNEINFLNQTNIRLARDKEWKSENPRRLEMRLRCGYHIKRVAKIRQAYIGNVLPLHYHINWMSFGYFIFFCSSISHNIFVIPHQQKWGEEEKIFAQTFGLFAVMNCMKFHWNFTSLDLNQFRFFSLSCTKERNRAFRWWLFCTTANSSKSIRNTTIIRAWNDSKILQWLLWKWGRFYR